MASTISAGTTAGTALNLQSDTTGNLAFKTGASAVTALTIDTNQNVTYANAVTYGGTIQGTTITATTGFSGNGVALTAINASNVTSGTTTVSVGGTGATTLTANNVIIGNGTSAVGFVAPGTNGNVLTSNGSAWTSTAPATPALPQFRTRVFASSTTWTAPTGCSYINALVIGGGGGGGGSTGGSSGGYGGVGGMASGEIAVVGGTTYTITVGAGGNGSNSTNGSTGGTTSIGALISATGGGGGAVNGNLNSASDGTGTNGTIVNTFIFFYGAPPFAGQADRPSAVGASAAIAWSPSLANILPGSRGGPEESSTTNNASGAVGGVVVIQYVG
jgi:fibronectin-binding autotransporter adhesin